MKEIHNLSSILKSKKPVAIFLYMQGCPHCIRMEEPWRDLDNENDIDFYKIESENIPSNLGISSFPHFLFIRNGKIANSVPGEMPKDELKRKLFHKRGGRRANTRRFRSRVWKSHRTLRVNV